MSPRCRANDDCAGKALPDGDLTSAARGDVRHRRSRIGANARDMDQPFYTARACEAGHARGCLDMHGVKGYAAVLDI